MRYLALAVFALVVACGGEASGERVLHFRDQDITEDAYKTHVRIEMAENPLMFGSLCNAIRGLSLDETEAFFETAVADDDSERPVFRGAVAIPGQEPQPESTRRATAIVMEECARMFPN